MGYFCVVAVFKIGMYIKKIQLDLGDQKSLKNPNNSG